MNKLGQDLVPAKFEHDLRRPVWAVTELCPRQDRRMDGRMGGKYHSSIQPFRT